MDLSLGVFLNNIIYTDRNDLPQNVAHLRKAGFVLFLRFLFPAECFHRYDDPHEEHPH